LATSAKQLLHSNVPQMTPVQIFVLWQIFKGDICQKTYWLGTFGKPIHQLAGKVLNNEIIYVYINFYS